MKSETFMKVSRFLSENDLKVSVAKAIKNKKMTFLIEKETEHYIFLKCIHTYEIIKMNKNDLELIDTKMLKHKCIQIINFEIIDGKIFDRHKVLFNKLLSLSNELAFALSLYNDKKSFFSKIMTNEVLLLNMFKSCKTDREFYIKFSKFIEGL